MSDTSEETDRSERPGDKEDSLCRDFVRGICDRKFCKYKHEYEAKMLNFCHDFQNTICPRNNCKFIHCTPEEELEYKRTGIMTNHMLAEATRKNQLPGTPPICNQFRKGLCRRNFCKYRHLTKEEEDAEIYELIQNNTKKNYSSFNNSFQSDQSVNNQNLNQALIRRNNLLDEDCGLPPAKRRFMGSQDQLTQIRDDLHSTPEPNRVRPMFKGYYASNPPSAMLSRADARTIYLEEENNMLHKEIVQLKRQVSDLTATNEFLLDQNANLRVSNKRNESVTMPAVTITNTNTPQVIGTVASVATVPVSLATVSTCNPVSVSIAGCPTVSMAPPAQILAPSQQILVTTNPTTQLAIANSSQAQLAIAQQNLANNLAQQAQPQLTSQPQQIALATTQQQLALANTQQQLTSQSQQLTLANTQQTLANQAQQLANQQLTSQAQQLANQQLSSQAQQLALASTNQQLTSQAQQLGIGSTTQHFTVANMPQQLALASTNQQLLAQQNLANNQQIEIHKISSSQALAMSNGTQPMVSYSIMTQQHALSH